MPRTLSSEHPTHTTAASRRSAVNQSAIVSMELTRRNPVYCPVEAKVPITRTKDSSLTGSSMWARAVARSKPGPKAAPRNSGPCQNW